MPVPSIRGPGVRNQLPDGGRIGSVALRRPRAAILWAVLAQLVITAAKFNKRFIILQQQQQPQEQPQSRRITHTRRIHASLVIISLYTEWSF